MIDEIVIGWKIFYGGGSIISSVDTSWELAEVNNVQVVNIYYIETYQHWNTTDKQWDTINYKKEMCMKDFYWKNQDGSFSCGNLESIPESLSQGSVKIGQMMLPDSDFYNIYNIAHQHNVVP